jgi:hypothetical protein
LGLFKINFDGWLAQGFSNPKFQSWKNRLVNGSFPSHWSQQQNAAINHSIYNITGYDIIGSTSMSSASDSSPSLETSFQRVIEGGPDKEDNVIIVNKKTSCEAKNVSPLLPHFLRRLVQMWYVF